MKSFQKDTRIEILQIFKQALPFSAQSIQITCNFQLVIGKTEKLLICSYKSFALLSAIDAYFPFHYLEFSINFYRKKKKKFKVR